MLAKFVFRADDVGEYHDVDDDDGDGDDADDNGGGDDNGNDDVTTKTMKKDNSNNGNKTTTTTWTTTTILHRLANDFPSTTPRRWTHHRCVVCRWEEMQDVRDNHWGIT